MDPGTKEIAREKLKEARYALANICEYEGTENYVETLESLILDERLDLSVKGYCELSEAVEDRLRSRLGILERLIDKEGITEIIVNGKNDIFLDGKDGLVRLDDDFESVEEIEEIIRNIAANVHREINEMNPILDARLNNGSRVNAVYKNVAAGGPALTIRKFSKERMTMAQMIEHDTLTVQCAEYLKELVECGYNIFISGGTSSGKTTFLNALSEYIPAKDRVIIVEDSLELQMDHIDNRVQMECHNANSLGKGLVSMDMLIRTSLRMRPDRIIVGEVRGREVADMLQAMNTGHDGSMSTGHGNSVRGMLRRLEAMYLMSANLPMDAIRAQIVEGIDIMVHLGRTREGRRMVLEIQELIDYSDGAYELNPLFVLNDDMELEATGNKLKNRSKLQFRGAGHGDRL
ncbi:CpaF family protein [Aminicella lysinilytica]|uniref:CpaF family protein n=1 Tax=Aminicella lysinilytica TaxID=433323 RepID=UPI0026EC3565|nr:ATPase, T2SS/T4P/T4SS family [Aminicella lysinilytica]